MKKIYKYNDFVLTRLRDEEKSEKQSDLWKIALLKKNFSTKKEIYFYGIPGGKGFDQWNDKKPKGISALRWFFASSRKKFEFFLNSLSIKQNFKFFQKVDSEWRTILIFKNNFSLIEKYGFRCGVDPDHIPDFFFSNLSKSLMEGDRKDLDKVGELLMVKDIKSSLEEIEEILERNKIIDPVVCLLDGDMFIMTNKREEILEK
jgi:hypothetical protein